MAYRYESEAAMYPVLFDYLRDQRRFVCAQVPVRSYRADFMSFQVDWRGIRERLRRGYYESIESAPLWRVLLAVKGNKGASPSELSSALRLSPSYTRSLLAQLERIELLEVASNEVRVLYWPQIVFHDAQVVEAKLTDWKRAVVQAARYTHYATECYVAVPQRLAQSLADRPPQSISRSGVGVMAVNGGVEIVRPSRLFETERYPAELHLLSEYLWRQIVRTLRSLNSGEPSERWLPTRPETLPSDLPVGAL